MLPGKGGRTLTPRTLLIPLLAAAFLGAASSSLKEEMKFGVEAAGSGLWREAIFRWQRFLKQNPDHPRLRNNLAVAYESLGDFERADAEYREALRLDPTNKEIRQNQEAFQEIHEEILRRRAEAAAVPTPSPSPSPEATP
jgi:Flp pilus assembly protein TadD